MPETKTWREDITLEPKLLFDVDDFVMARFTIGEDRLFASFSIPAPRQPIAVTRVDASLTGWTVKSPRVMASLPGSREIAVEDIARWVAGDRSDPQRVALADGIRQGLPFEASR